MSSEYAQVRARLMYDPEELNYDFGPEHPLQSRRLVALMDLLESSGLWCGSDQQRCLPFRAATIEELGMVYTSNYIEAVQRLSRFQIDRNASLICATLIFLPGVCVNTSDSDSGSVATIGQEQSAATSPHLQRGIAPPSRMVSAHGSGVYCNKPV